MPDKLPLPIVGEETIEDDPVLGKPLDNFPSRRLRALLTGGAVLVGVSLLLNAALFEIDAVWVAPLVITVTALLALAVGWWILHQWNREVILYERGFSYREGSENVPFLYGEVSSIRLRAEQLAYFGGLLRRVIYRITIRTRAGDRIVLDNTYNRVEQLADKLVEQVNVLLRPVVQERLRRGETVSFAEGVALSDEGLHIDADLLENPEAGTVLPWSQFGGYKIARRHLYFVTADDTLWFGLPLSDVDNLTLLLGILRERRTMSEETVA